MSVGWMLMRLMSSEKEVVLF